MRKCMQMIGLIAKLGRGARSATSVAQAMNLAVGGILGYTGSVEHTRTRGPSWYCHTRVVIVVF